jgi:acyl-CoA thioesterase-1
MNRAAIRQKGGSVRFARSSIAYAVVYGLVLPILLSAAICAARAADPVLLVTYGDSLSAGYNLAEEDSFPVQLEKALKARGHDVRVVNASVSGDTTAAGLVRFDWSFPEGADGAILELGANDALRGLKPATTRANLDKLLTRIKQKGAESLLAGMLAPRNMGAQFTGEFDRIYPELAEKHGVLLYPFFLFDVIGKTDLLLDDGLHPNARGVKKIVEQIVPKVEELLKQIASRRAKTQ